MYLFIVSRSFHLGRYKLNSEMVEIIPISVIFMSKNCKVRYNHPNELGLFKQKLLLRTHEYYIFYFYILYIIYIC